MAELVVSDWVHGARGSGSEPNLLPRWNKERPVTGPTRREACADVTRQRVLRGWRRAQFFGKPTSILHRQAIGFTFLLPHPYSVLA